MKYPALPKQIELPGGTVTIVLRPSLKREDGSPAWGLWDDATRIIELDQTMSPRQRWRIFYHEVAHVALDDAGLSNMLTDQQQEALCDALATARMRERFG